MQNKNFKRKKAKTSSADQLAKGILNGELTALSRGITLCESRNTEDRLVAGELINRCLPHSGNSIRIGITGVPGVGKSTFIESFGVYLIEQQNRKVAVLAVDPSSKQTKGSILGDKTRMEELSVHPKAFIRPSPTAGSLGGVAHQSRESIILCEAAGFDTIIVETVGVGQSETEVKEMTDFFLLLMLAGAGDELQGIKRGIMEMADGILINKADGDNVQAARIAKREYQNALHLFPPNSSQWIPKVDICSALEKQNIEKAWTMISNYFEHTKKNNFFEQQRNEQLQSWFLKSVDEQLHQSLFSSAELKVKLEQYKQTVINKKISPQQAAQELFDQYIAMLRDNSSF